MPDMSSPTTDQFDLTFKKNLWFLKRWFHLKHFNELSIWMDKCLTFCQHYALRGGGEGNEGAPNFKISLVFILILPPHHTSNDIEIKICLNLVKTWFKTLPTVFTPTTTMMITPKTKPPTKSCRRSTINCTTSRSPSNSSPWIQRQSNKDMVSKTIWKTFPKNYKPKLQHVCTYIHAYVERNLKSKRSTMKDKKRRKGGSGKNE